MSAASGVVWGREVRVLVTHPHYSEEDLGPGLGETGPYCLVPVGVLVYRMETSGSSLECAGVKQRGGPEVGPHGRIG